MNANTCNTIRVVCRGVDLTAVAANANSTFVYDLEKELQANPSFDSARTRLVGALSPQGLTFTVEVLITPVRPLKL